MLRAIIDSMKESWTITSTGFKDSGLLADMTYTLVVSLQIGLGFVWIDHYTDSSGFILMTLAIFLLAIFAATHVLARIPQFPCPEDPDLTRSERRDVRLDLANSARVAIQEGFAIFTVWFYLAKWRSSKRSVI